VQPSRDQQRQRWQPFPRAPGPGADRTLRDVRRFLTHLEFAFLLAVAILGLGLGLYSWVAP
jgi:hypothetical protein